MVCIFLLTYINTKGVKTGKTIQLIFTSAKLIALFAIIILGLYVGLKNDTDSILEGGSMQFESDNVESSLFDNDDIEKG